jgi:hypothetical protein
MTENGQPFRSLPETVEKVQRERNIVATGGHGECRSKEV